jgi:hypothetical protein
LKKNHLQLVSQGKGSRFPSKYSQLESTNLMEEMIKSDELDHLPE